MNSLQKVPMNCPDSERIAQPFAGCAVASVVVAGKSDFSDWVELIEVVEALCPVWPPQDPPIEGLFRM